MQNWGQQHFLLRPVNGMVYYEREEASGMHADRRASFEASGGGSGNSNPNPSPNLSHGRRVRH